MVLIEVMVLVGVAEVAAAAMVGAISGIGRIEYTQANALLPSVTVPAKVD